MLFYSGKLEPQGEKDLLATLLLLTDTKITHQWKKHVKLAHTCTCIGLGELRTKIFIFFSLLQMERRRLILTALYEVVF